VFVVAERSVDPCQVIRGYEPGAAKVFEFGQYLACLFGLSGDSIGPSQLGFVGWAGIRQVHAPLEFCNGIVVPFRLEIDHPQNRMSRNESWISLDGRLELASRVIIMAGQIKMKTLGLIQIWRKRIVAQCGIDFGDGFAESSECGVKV